MKMDGERWMEKDGGREIDRTTEMSDRRGEKGSLQTQTGHGNVSWLSVQQESVFVSRRGEMPGVLSVGLVWVNMLHVDCISQFH